MAAMGNYWNRLCQSAGGW